MSDEPAGVGRPTYWHQDEAYSDPAVERRAFGAWMPLSECTIEMGCMRFIPGSHRDGVLPHHSRRPDIRPDLYEVVEEVDDSRAVACPLPAGGATFHHVRTLHYIAPNVSPRTRRVNAIEFETKPVRRAVPAATPWITATRAILGEPASHGYSADGEHREHEPGSRDPLRASRPAA